MNEADYVPRAFPPNPNGSITQLRGMLDQAVWQIKVPVTRDLFILRLSLDWHAHGDAYSLDGDICGGGVDFGSGHHFRVASMAKIKSSLTSICRLSTRIALTSSPRMSVGLQRSLA